MKYAVNRQALRDRIYNKGYRVAYMSDVLNISRMGFFKKMRGDSPFKEQEVKVLCDVLDIEQSELSYFFRPKDDKSINNRRTK